QPTRTAPGLRREASPPSKVLNPPSAFGSTNKGGEHRSEDQEAKDHSSLRNEPQSYRLTRKDEKKPSNDRQEIGDSKEHLHVYDPSGKPSRAQTPSRFLGQAMIAIAARLLALPTKHIPRPAS
ncbi:MAG: hypothetical protein AAF191_16545, partial [Verrucomicrobiota bacterium]